MYFHTIDYVQSALVYLFKVSCLSEGNIEGGGNLESKNAGDQVC
jgi:hypothetical protein